MKKTAFIVLLLAALSPAISGNAQNDAGTIPAPETVNVDGQRPQDAYSLPWRTTMEADIAWKKRVWRNVDMKDPQNAPFVYNAAIGKEHNLSRFLVQGAATGVYKAYSAANEGFTTELTTEELAKMANKLTPDKIVGYRIKEDWLYLAKEHRVVVRIVGMAPLVEERNGKGGITVVPAFWLYYPDVRQYFAGQEVYISGTRSGMNWDQLLERGLFRGKSDKIVDTKKN